VPPYLAMVAMTAGDSLAVRARVAGLHPGAGALIAQLAALVLLALTPWTSSIWSAGTRWIGGARQVATAAAAATAAIACLLVLVQALVGGHMPAPVEFFVLGAIGAVLAIRVVSLVRRVDSWSRVWQESGRQFRQLAERTSDVVLLCDLDGVIRYASRAVAGYGYSPEALRGTPLADLLHPEDRAAGMRAVRRASLGKAQRVGRYPCRVRAADGTWRHVQSTMSRYIDPGHPDRLLLTARDMSAQVALRRQVTHLTFNDGLTGLPNRAYAEQRGQDVLSHRISAAGAPDGPGTVAGVIILDLDGFTAMNEGRGSTAADLLLAQVARRLRLAVSPQDTVARWGGDEFAVLTESAESAEELAEIAERLSRSVASQPFRIGEEDLAITASVGVALADGSPAAHVWRNAEMALARAKGSGTGEVEVFGLGTGEASPAEVSPDEVSPDEVSPDKVSADGAGAAGTGSREPEPGRASDPVASAGPLAADGPGLAAGGLAADEPGPVVSTVGEAAETPAGAGT
jgi:diguanylate cyclase (GGDEF)-like protein/PAS domain S-box-containing protein